MWARFIDYWRQISPILVLAFAGLTAMGFGWQTPKQWFDRFAAADVRIGARIDTLAAEVKLGQRARDTINLKLDFLVRGECQRLTSGERARRAECDPYVRSISTGTVAR